MQRTGPIYDTFLGVCNSLKTVAKLMPAAIAKAQMTVSRPKLAAVAKSPLTADDMV